jgi:hypothetical protein
VGLYEWFWASLHEAPCTRLGTRFLLLLMALSSVLFTLDSSAELGVMAVAAWGMSLLLIVWAVLPSPDVSWPSMVAARARFGIVAAVAVGLEVVAGLPLLGALAVAAAGMAAVDGASAWAVGR